MIDLASASISDLGAALRAGTVRSSDLFAQVAANRDEDLGAYKLWLPERAASAAAMADAAFAEGLDFGPLQGLPISVKDLYGLAGSPTHAGAPRALPGAWEREGPVVRAVRSGMGCVVGKTHTVEFAFGGIGSNPHWGTPRNPWSREVHRVPGGSSAGAGVSLWEGTAVIALGSDTAGSVRVPASFTGTVGLKTTWGRWSLDGLVPLSPVAGHRGHPDPLGRGRRARFLGHRSPVCGPARCGRCLAASFRCRRGAVRRVCAGHRRRGPRGDPRARGQGRLDLPVLASRARCRARGLRRRWSRRARVRGLHQP